MLIKSVEVKERTYDCYEFTLIGPVSLPVTLDLEAGDQIDISSDKIILTVQERPSLSDPKKFLPAETWVVERSNLLFYQHCIRRTVEQTAEQHQEWKESLFKPTSSVN